MMYRENIVEIDDKKFKIRVLGSRDGRALLLKIIKLVGPAMAEFLNKQNDDKSSKDLLDQDFGNTVGPAIEKLCMSLNENDYEKMIDTLAGKTQMQINEGEWVQLNKVRDMAFAGNYDLEMKWLLAALKENYGSFLGGFSEIANYANNLKSEG